MRPGRHPPSDPDDTWVNFVLAVDVTRRARGDDARSRMDLLVPLQHPDELLDPPGAGLHLFRGLNPEQNGVPVAHTFV